MVIKCFPEFKLDVLRFELKPNEDLEVYVSKESVRSAAKEGLWFYALSIIGTFAYECVQLFRDPVRKVSEIFSKTVFHQVLNKGMKFGIGAFFFGAAENVAKRSYSVWKYNRAVSTNWDRTALPSMQSGDEIITALLQDREFIEDSVATEVCCPINLTFMLRPTQLPCHPEHIFDRKAIEHWAINESSRCPMCRKEVNLIDAKHSEPTFMKSCFIIKHIAQRLSSFRAPPGVNILNARRVIQGLGKRINKRNDAIYLHSVNYIRKNRADEFADLHKKIVDWKKTVDIPEISIGD